MKGLRRWRCIALLVTVITLFLLGAVGYQFVQIHTLSQETEQMTEQILKLGEYRDSLKQKLNEQ